VTIVHTHRAAISASLVCAVKDRSGNGNSRYANACASGRPPRVARADHPDQYRRRQHRPHPRWPRRSAGVRASSFTSVDHALWSSEVPSGRGWRSRALDDDSESVRSCSGSLPSMRCLPAAGPLEPVRTVH
jgi:hypothetical protein